jgi:hypothetical protein
MTNPMWAKSPCRISFYNRCPALASFYTVGPARTPRMLQYLRCVPVLMDNPKSDRLALRKRPRITQPRSFATVRNLILLPPGNAAIPTWG